MNAVRGICSCSMSNAARSMRRMTRAAATRPCDWHSKFFSAEQRRSMSTSAANMMSGTATTSMHADIMTTMMCVPCQQGSADEPNHVPEHLNGEKREEITT